MNADVTMRFSAETAKAVQGFLRLEESQRKVALETAKVTREGGKARKSMEDMSTSSMAATKAVSGLASAGGAFIASFASLGTLTNMMNAFATASDKARQVMSANWDRGVSVQSRLVALANQRGRSDNAGFYGAAVDAQNIAFGSGGTLDMGAAAAQSADSILSHLPKNVRMGIAMEAAGYGAAAGASPDDVALLMELLAKAKVENVADARKRISQMYGGVLASSTTSGGRFARGTLKGLSAGMAMGMTFEEAITTFGQSRAEGAGSEDVAAELSKQMINQLNDPEVQKFITQYGGTPYEQLGPRQALDVLVTAFNDPKAKASREKVFKGEKLSQALRFTSPSAVVQGQSVAKAVANANPEAYNLYRRTFLDSDLALENWYQADRDVKALQRTNVRAVRDKMVDDLLEQQSGEFQPLREFIKSTTMFGDYAGKEFEVSDRNEIDALLNTRNPKLDALAPRKQRTPLMDFGDNLTRRLLQNLFPTSDAFDAPLGDAGGSRGGATTVIQHNGDVIMTPEQSMSGRHVGEPDTE